MKAKRKKRLMIISALMLGLGVSVSLTLYALSNNINLYYTPTQLHADHVPQGKTIRIGGLVEVGTVKRGDDLNVAFVLTDEHQTVPVQYHGILPVLFREGQGIVAQGKMNSRGVFVADQVLAKHDENYTPPGINKPSMAMNYDS